MSKNIVIQEGGVGRQFTADKLKTDLVAGGTCLWVPEDEVQLGTKTITENGTYKASDDGYYGYEQVVVSIANVGQVTGTDGDGDEATVKPDPETGDLVTTKIPSSIKVVTPPTVTTYSDGATIDFSGMVVKAYLKTGGLWTDSTHPNGIIPISELALPVTEADKGKTISDKWSDGSGVNATLVTYSETWDTTWDGKSEYHFFKSQQLGNLRDGLPAFFGSSDGPTQFFATRFIDTDDNEKFCVWGATADRALNVYEFDSEREYHKYSLVEGTSASTGKDVIKVFSSNRDKQSGTGWFAEVATSTVKPTGNENMSKVDAYQSIPVQWNRPGDGTTLESSFDITVT